MRVYQFRHPSEKRMQPIGVNPDGFKQIWQNMKEEGAEGERRREGLNAEDALRRSSSYGG